MDKSKLMLASVLLASALMVQAAENTNKWEASASAGLTLTRGNSETLLGTMGVNARRKLSNGEVLLGATGTYGETTDQDTDETDKNADSATAFGQYNREITDRWYAGFRADFLYDGIADVHYRVTLSPLVGYYAVKRPMTTLKFEAGPAGVFERVGSEDDTQYAALRLAERFEHKFSDKAKVWQSLEFVPQVDRFHNYIITAEIGAEAALNNSLSLRAVLQDVYDNVPAEGRKKNDIKLITSLVYKF